MTMQMAVDAWLVVAVMQSSILFSSAWCVVSNSEHIILSYILSERVETAAPALLFFLFSSQRHHQQQYNVIRCSDRVNCMVHIARLSANQSCRQENNDTGENDNVQACSSYNIFEESLIKLLLIIYIF